MSLRTAHVLAIVGGVVVFVATAVSWYTYDASAEAGSGQVAYSITKTYTLWDVTTLAPVLIVIGAVVGTAALLFAPPSSTRTAASVAGLLGLGIVAYCVVKCFDIPDLGPTGSVAIPVSGAAAGVRATASATLNAGPFVGIVGGLLMIASAAGLTWEAPEAATGVRRSSSHTGAEST